MTNGRPATDPPDPADSLLRSNVDIPARGAVKGPIRPGNGRCFSSCLSTLWLCLDHLPNKLTDSLPSGVMGASPATEPATQTIGSTHS